MNKITIVCTLLVCFACSLEAAAKLSVYDPLGILSVEERSSIEAEGQALIASRKVNGQDLLIQIDFLTSEEFDKGGVNGWNKDFRTLFSLGTYTSWSVKYYGKPAVLILFLDQGDGQYVLDALNFSDKLMDEGIPDLVRRYIRDEIVEKQTSRVEMISSGLYAISEALNPVYRQRLEQKGNQMLTTDDRYHRAHCVYGDCSYYEFAPEEKSVIGPTQPKDAITFHGLPESKSDNLESVISNTIDWDHTHESKIVSDWPWIWDNDEKGYILDQAVPEDYFSVKKDNPWSILNTNSITKDMGELLPTMGWISNTGNKEIIQAGNNTGILTVEEGFGAEVDVSINLYLGFLKKVI